jgi:sugar lactone lactonase YvrE
MTHQVHTVSDGHSFLESARWHEGSLYVCDVMASEILRFREGLGPPEIVASLDWTPGGLGFLPNGDLLAVSMTHNAIFRVGESVDLYADLTPFARGALNDMLVHDDGTVYVGCTGFPLTDEADFGPAPIIVVLPDGEIVVGPRTLNCPNGIVRLPDGRLLVAETYAGRVTVFELDSRGVPTSQTVWAEWGPSVNYYDIERAHGELSVEPDGLALGPEDTVWVADANGRGIARVREGGVIEEYVEVGDLSVFSAVEVASRLFVCCAPRNRTIDWADGKTSELRVAHVDRRQAAQIP